MLRIMTLKKTIDEIINRDLESLKESWSFRNYRLVFLALFL